MLRTGVRSLKVLEFNAYRIGGPIKVLVPVEMKPKRGRKKKNPLNLGGYDLKVGTFDPTDDLAEVDRCYRRVEDVICFIDGDYMYAVPYCNVVEHILKKEGFREDRFIKVPFTFGSRPKCYASRWDSLLEWQVECKRLEEDGKHVFENRIHVVREFEPQRYAASF